MATKFLTKEKMGTPQVEPALTPTLESLTLPQRPKLGT